jgi:hypothetical protein
MILQSDRYRIWLTQFLALVLLSLIAMTVSWPSSEKFREERTSRLVKDPRYAKVIDEIKTEKLNASDIFLAALPTTDESPLMKFTSRIMLYIILLAFYTLAYRCIARVTLGAWKSPWTA